MTLENSATSTTNGPVRPGAGTAVALQPLGSDQIRLRGGFWGRWQDANRRISIPHALAWLNHDGVIDNLGRLADSSYVRQGPLYSDSDLYKTMEAIAWELGRSGAPELAGIMDELIDVVVRAQEPDGYLNSYVQAGLAPRWDDLADGHELYCIGHLIQAAIAHRRATGSVALLDVATRAADLVVGVFGEDGHMGVDGHEEIETALVELARETGEDAYLQQALLFLRRRGNSSIHSQRGHTSSYYQDAVAPHQQREAVGHAVRAAYLVTGMIDAAVETGDTELLTAASEQWLSMTNEKMQITGALGSRFEDESFGDPFELGPDRTYGETCATIGHLAAGWRLLLATGSPQYAEALDRSMHNLLAASTGLDRQSFFYNNPTQRRCALDAADPRSSATRAEAPGTRPPWFETACCPPNVMRTIATLHTMIATTTVDAVQLHIPIACDLTLDDLDIELRVTSDYPHSGDIEIEVMRSRSTPLALEVRIPSWATGAVVQVNGRSSFFPRAGNYLRVERVWEVGDVLSLRLPMEPRLTVFHPAADALRGTVAIERGPLVYCVESVDNGEVDLAAVNVRPSVAARERALEIGSERAAALHLAAEEVPLADWERSWRPLATRGEAHPRPIELVAIPYFLWANRGPATMRVHLPFDAEPATS